MNKLCVISGAQLEKQDGDYWGRFAFVDYLEEMTYYFRKVTFFTRVKSGRERYSTNWAREYLFKRSTTVVRKEGPLPLWGTSCGTSLSFGSYWINRAPCLYSTRAAGRYLCFR